MAGIASDGLSFSQFKHEMAEASRSGTFAMTDAKLQEYNLPKPLETAIREMREGNVFRGTEENIQKLWNTFKAMGKPVDGPQPGGAIPDKPKVMTGVRLLDGGNRIGGPVVEAFMKLAIETL